MDGTARFSAARANAAAASAAVWAALAAAAAACAAARAAATRGGSSGSGDGAGVDLLPARWSTLAEAAASPLPLPENGHPAGGAGHRLTRVLSGWNCHAGRHRGLFESGERRVRVVEVLVQVLDPFEGVLVGQ